MTRQVSRWAVLAITLLAACLRLYHLGAQSLWFDEAFPVVVTRLPLKESLDGILTLGAYSPFFYLLLRPVTALLGQSEFAYHLLSAFFGILTVPLMYRVGARWMGWSAGLLAALLLAVCPFHLLYSQDARMYTMMGFFSLAAMDQFERKLRGGGRWALLIVFSALAYLSHYAAIFMIYVQLVCLLPKLKQAQLFRRWFAAQAMALLPLAPWMALNVITNWKTRALGIGWIPRPDWLTLPLTLWNFISGDTDTWNVAVLALAAVCGLVLARGVFVQFRENRFLLWWLFLPLATNLAVSLRQPLYVDRYFAGSLPAYIFLLAAGATRWRSRWMQAAASLVLLGVMAWGVVRVVSGDPYFAKEDWRGATAFIEAQVKADDAVALEDYETVIGLSAYRTREWPRLVLRPGEESALLDDAAARAPRVWLIWRSPRESSHRLSKSEPFDVFTEATLPVRDWLSAHRNQVALDLRLPGLSVVRLDRERP
jgi:uncharacterized membrane protein